jgi:hypothetical protein
LPSPAGFFFIGLILTRLFLLRIDSKWAFCTSHPPN